GLYRAPADRTATTPTNVIEQTVQPGGTDQPFNSFRNSNVPGPGTSGTDPYEWLTHLDRPLVNAIELFHVSAYKPHELTQLFMYSTTTKHAQVAPWLVENSFLFRALEFMNTGERAQGVAHGGRIPGRVNINTFFPQTYSASGSVTRSGIFRALADANPSN